MISHLQKKYIPIVLCAGFGTRLKPLTNFIPKVVSPLIDKPFAFYNIEKFFKAGFETVHCNTHYLPDIVKNELISACEFFGYDKNRLRFWHEDDILETGGGIARIFQELCAENSENLKKDLLVVSGDIVADFPLKEIMERWENKKDNELALMCSKNLKEFRKDVMYVHDNLSEVAGFGEQSANLNRSLTIVPKLFTNHQVISGQVVHKCKIEKKSSIDLFYRSILQEGKKVINFAYDESLYWFNIGTPQEYLDSIHYFTKNNSTPINYAFNMPRDIENLLHTYLNKSLPLLNKLPENSISIAFRNAKKLAGGYISINTLCAAQNEKQAIYFCF